MLVYVAGFSHAFTAMDLTDEHHAFHFVRSFYYVTALDLDSVEEFYRPVTDQDTEKWALKAILAVVTFLIPIGLMNIFIAALGTSYNTGVQHMEELFQHRKAASVFDLLAAKKMFISLCRCLHLTHKHTATQRHLWVSWKRSKQQDVI